MSEVQLILDGTRFRFWEQMRLVRSMDSMSTVDLSAPLEDKFRGLLKPFGFQVVECLVDAIPIFKGWAVRIDPQIAPDSRRVTLSAYALPGTMGDCTMPPEAFPIEFNGMTFGQAFAEICRLSGVVGFVSDPYAAATLIEKVTLGVEDKPMETLISLAKSRGLLLRDTPVGQLEAYSPLAVGVPVANLTEGESPLISVSPRFDPQKYFSHVTGVLSPKSGDIGGKYTMENPLRSTLAYRPHVYREADDITTGELPAAVAAKIGRMIGEMCSYTVQVASWKTPLGSLWSPGDRVTLAAPGAMVYAPTVLTVRSATLEKTSEGETASLELVIPESYTGGIPARVPWES